MLLPRLSCQRDGTWDHPSRNELHPQGSTIPPQCEEGRAASWKSCRARAGEDRAEKAAKDVTTSPGVMEHSDSSSSTAMFMPLLPLQGNSLGPASCIPQYRAAPWTRRCKLSRQQGARRKANKFPCNPSQACQQQEAAPSQHIHLLLHHQTPACPEQPPLTISAFHRAWGVTARCAIPSTGGPASSHPAPWVAGEEVSM